MLNWAVKNELLARNVLDSVSLLPTSARHVRRARRALSEDECKRFLKACVEDDDESMHGRNRMPAVFPQEPMWRFLIETGARFGEMAALRWRDVSIPGACATLRAETTKTQRERTVPLTAKMLERLRRMQELQVQQAGGKAVDPDGIVFVSPLGSVQHQSNSYRRFQQLLIRAGIPRKSPAGQLDIHALRHTAATRLARAGIGLAQAQYLLGHADPRMTAQVYTKLVAEDVRGAVLKLPAL